MRAAIYPYKSSSEGAKFLSEHLEARIIRRFRDLREDEILINWGSGEIPASTWNRNWLNRPSAVMRCIDKLKAFELFTRTGVPHPKFTLVSATARLWLEEGHVVLARQTACGMMGEGISVLMAPQRDFPSAEFYSQHVKHDDEYRVHVFRGRIINIGKKIAEVSNPNLLVRNYGRDWKFYNNDAPMIVRQVGIDAVRSLGLDFGAADIGFCRDRSRAYVFEVNSAPGSGHNTITRYAEAITRHLENCDG